MKQTKIDSVQNFLTPSKLLTSKMKPTHKPKPTASINNSLVTSNPNESTLKTWGSPNTPRRQLESYKKRKETAIQESDTIEGRQGQHQRNGKYLDKDLLHHSNNNAGKKSSDLEEDNRNGSRFLLNVVKDAPNQSVNFSDSRVSKNSGQGNSARYKPVGNYTRSQAMIRPKQYDEKAKAQQQKRNYIVPVKKNPQIAQLQIRELMHRLITIRNELQEEIAELKNLLDNTSNNLENIDIEYEKIKEKILIFTSRALDASFNEYKKNLPDWGKYENVETVGLNKIADINFLVQNHQANSDFGSSAQMQKKLQGYKHFIGEVRDARMECLSRRPNINEERLRKFESAVWELSKF